MDGPVVQVFSEAPMGCLRPRYINTPQSIRTFNHTDFGGALMFSVYNVFTLSLDVLFTVVSLYPSCD